MEPDRWRQVWTLFHGALECAEGEARAAFLDEACTGDCGLRAELDSLLVAHRQSDTGSSGSASEATVLLGADTGPDGRIGPYRLVRRIGEGGGSVLYECWGEAVEAYAAQAVAAEREKMLRHAEIAKSLCSDPVEALRSYCVA